MEKELQTQFSRRNKKIYPWIFTSIVFIFSLWARIPTFRNPFNINPDEAEMLTAGKLAAKSFFPYQNYTTSTFEPVWPEFLSIFQTLGIDLNFITVHILAFILLLTSFLGLQLLILIKNQNVSLITYLSFLAIDFAIFLPTNYEFAFLSSETLPIFLISMSLFILIYPKAIYSLNKFLAGSLCAFAFLAKYQVAPLIIIVYFCSFCVEHNKKQVTQKFKHLLNFLGGFLSTLSIFIFLIFLGGGFSKFLDESIRFSTLYSVGKLSGFSASGDLFAKIQSGSSLIYNEPSVLFALILCVISLLMTQSKPFAFIVSKKRSLTIPTYLFSLFAIFLGFITIAVTGNRFPHYLLFLFWALQCSLILPFLQHKNSRNVKEIPRNTKKFVNSSQLLSFLFLVVILLTPNFNQISTEIQSKFSKVGPTEKDLDLYVKSLNTYGFNRCVANSQVLIWGWSSEFYTYFNWNPPENIAATTTSMLLAGYEPSTLSNRIKTAVYDSKTICIFEAIGPKYFSGISTEKTIVRTIPVLEGYLNENFVKFTVPDQGGTLWVRNVASD